MSDQNQTGNVNNEGTDAAALNSKIPDIYIYIIYSEGFNTSLVKDITNALQTRSIYQWFLI